MSSYSDPILRLVLDPDLNRTKAKSDALVQLIQGFPLTERKVLKLCSGSLSILQALEKLNLQLKSWEFLSLDINSDTHFNDNDDRGRSIKSFNVSLAQKVLERCVEMNTKLATITRDLDHVSAQSKTLTPLEYISDSGTTLTSLVLRSIKLKNSVSDKTSIAYSKASLICIGSELEAMLSSDQYNMDLNDQSTVAAYKVFIGNLMRQLNTAIENEDNTAKLECLAVMNDMEKMFDAFKLEKMRQAAVTSYQLQMEMYHLITAQEEDDEEEDYDNEDDEVDEVEGFVNIHHHRPPSSPINKQEPRTPTPVMASDTEEFGDYDSDGYPSSMFSSFTSQQPLVHSITTSNRGGGGAVLPVKRERRDSSSSLTTSMLLHKTTLAEEMPNLMTAFDSVRNVNVDVAHYKEEESKELARKGIRKKALPKQSSPNHSPPNHTPDQPPPPRQFPNIKNHLPDIPLYQQSQILKQSNISNSASSYVYANNSLLSRLGIRPQVITTTTGSQLKLQPQEIQQRHIINGDSSTSGKVLSSSKRLSPEEKENESHHQQPKHMLLTAENLECHNLAANPILNDFVD
ncbi:uncharacterized protein KQ657_001922 [Scheffersomyces spartinae]|uniref:Uncharacterized protein n=1 Tax=Scheffersomyces spartinae TaxID=45513 RepID=A0A9P7V6C5_9ASCO|nr:uncharacterized protein KQ657_001922 [Scheffersomyces spartinae]KAG7192204.1 hypothetical protein KQ657_001922 [Scheffersomyces spartinae]